MRLTQPGTLYIKQVSASAGVGGLSSRGVVTIGKGTSGIGDHTVSNGRQWGAVNCMWRESCETCISPGDSKKFLGIFHESMKK